MMIIIIKLCLLHSTLKVILHDKMFTNKKVLLTPVSFISSAIMLMLLRTLCMMMVMSTFLDLSAFTLFLKMSPHT